MRRLLGALDELFRPGGDGKVFYGWRIVAVGTALQLLNSGLFLQAYGAYVVLLQADLGWSRTMLSAGFAMARSESAVLGPIQGALLDRFGPRAIMRIGVVLFGAGFLLLSIMQTPWHFFVAVFVIAVGSSFAGFISVTVAVVNWFRRRRSTALGFASSGFALGGLIVPLLVLALETFGWRATAFGSGLLLLTAGPAIVQVVRHRPAELGLQVDGFVDPVDAEPVAGEGPDRVAGGSEDAPPGEGGTADATADPTGRSAPDGGGDAEVAFTARQAMRTTAFWYVSIAHALAVFFASALMVHLIPHLTGELGYSLELAGLVVALLTIMQFIGMSLGGAVGDFVDKRLLSVVTMVMHGSAALLLTVAVTPVLVIVFAVVHGLAWGVRSPLVQAWRADLFGSASYGAIIGFSSLVVMLGAASGPIMAGIMYDALGDYTSALQVLAACCGVGAVLFWLVRIPRPPEPAAVTARP